MEVVAPEAVMFTYKQGQFGRFSVAVNARRLGLTIMVAALFATLGSAPGAFGQDAPKGPQWKDRQEFDMFDAANKATDPNKKIEAVKAWEQKYPETEFKLARLQLYLDSYVALGQAPKIIDTSKQMLAVDPTLYQPLYWLTLALPTSSGRTPSADAVDQAEKAANGLLGVLDKTFSTANKPANMTEDQWKTMRTGIQGIAHRTLGWAALQRKNYDEAENQLTQSLKLTPDNGYASLWMGNTIVGTKKPERIPEALFHFSRVAQLAGPAGLDDATRQAMDKYVTDNYTKFHGSPEGVDDLKKLAKANALPPADGLHIKSIVDIEKEKADAEEKAAKENPVLAFWQKVVKAGLNGPDSEKFWNDTMKDAMLPGSAVPGGKLKGKLISMKPALRPKELVLAVENGTTPDVMLKFEEPLAGKMEAGAELSFAGVADSFTKEPFMVVFKVEPDDLAGWTGKNAGAPAAKKAPVTKKTTPKKK